MRDAENRKHILSGYTMYLYVEIRPIAPRSKEWAEIVTTNRETYMTTGKLHEGKQKVGCFPHERTEKGGTGTEHHERLTRRRCIGWDRIKSNFKKAVKRNNQFFEMLFSPPSNT